MQRLLALASGKGGVGKSVLAANLGLALSRLGKTVVLVDLDLGASNLHTCLGIRNRNPGLGAFVWKQEKSLSGLLVETGQERLWLIPGDSLLPGTANLEWSAKRRILKELGKLPADYIILDLGAGSAYNVIDFYLAAGQGLLVINPEITSVLNAYSFLKTAAFRLLVSAFPNKSEQRAEVMAFAGAKTEGSGSSFLAFAEDLARRWPGKAELALAALRRLGPQVILNRAKAPEDAELGYRLRDISRKNLGLDVAFSGFLLEDGGVGRSVAARMPLLSIDPGSPFSRGVMALATRLANSPAPEAATWGQDEEGLEALATEAFEESWPEPKLAGPSMAAAPGPSVAAAPSLPDPSPAEEDEEPIAVVTEEISLADFPEALQAGPSRG